MKIKSIEKYYTHDLRIIAKTNRMKNFESFAVSMSFNKILSLDVHNVKKQFFINLKTRLVSKKEFTSDDIPKNKKNEFVSTENLETLKKLMLEQITETIPKIKCRNYLETMHRVHLNEQKETLESII